MTFSLEDLNRRIVNRAGDDPADSYTASLLAKGVARCAQKVGEEATETIIAAMGEDDRGLVAESADLLYHLLVLLRSRDIALDHVLAVLEKRTSLSGHQEKASRNPD